jgi:hypothetical protein
MVEMSVKTLLDIDVLEDLIEDVLLEALHQDEEVEVKVTGPIACVVNQPIKASTAGFADSLRTRSICGVSLGSRPMIPKAPSTTASDAGSITS